ncbi:MAG: hypothetical protein NTW10_00305 [Bacteroidetes bacterium]|nr:hypothetical protein [Bacteroidota bacterium]
MVKSISTEIAKKRLATVWFVIGGILFLFMLSLTLTGRFGTKLHDVWSWFLPIVFPSLTLMIGVFAVDALSSGVKPAKIDRYIFVLTFIMSIVYLLTILVVLIVSSINPEPIDIMTASNFGLGPFQGVVSACIGIFFIQKDKGK